MKGVEIFCCYARQDRDLLTKLKIHLMPLQQQGLIPIWSDTDSDAGAVWAEEIRRHLESADIFLLLIRPDFMASNYCYRIEMQKALQRHDRGNARVIPVLLRPVFWQNAPFLRREAHENGRPLPEKSRPSGDEKAKERELAGAVTFFYVTRVSHLLTT